MVRALDLEVEGSLFTCRPFCYQLTTLLLMLFTRMCLCRQAVQRWIIPYGRELGKVTVRLAYVALVVYRSGHRPIRKEDDHPTYTPYACVRSEHLEQFAIVSTHHHLPSYIPSIALKTHFLNVHFFLILLY